MLNKQLESHEEIELLRQAVTNDRNTGSMPFRDFTADEIKQSLMPGHELNKPVEDLIATTEAVFEFVRRLEMKRSTKKAFAQLEKQFDFYRNLVLLK